MSVTCIAVDLPGSPVTVLFAESRSCEMLLYVFETFEVVKVLPVVVTSTSEVVKVLLVVVTSIFKVVKVVIIVGFVLVRSLVD